MIRMRFSNWPTFTFIFSSFILLIVKRQISEHNCTPILCSLIKRSSEEKSQRKWVKRKSAVTRVLSEYRVKCEQKSDIQNENGIKRKREREREMECEAKKIFAAHLSVFFSVPRWVAGREAESLMIFVITERHVESSRGKEERKWEKGDVEKKFYIDIYISKPISLQLSLFSHKKVLIWTLGLFLGCMEWEKKGGRLKVRTREGWIHPNCCLACLYIHHPCYLGKKGVRARALVLSLSLYLVEILKVSDALTRHP